MGREEENGRDEVRKERKEGGERGHGHIAKLKSTQQHTYVHTRIHARICINTCKSCCH